MKEKTKAFVKSRFSATRIAYMALFTALAFVVTFLEFPIFPTANFLKLDFANVFFMIEGFIFGPVEAVVSIGIKELLCFIAKTTTSGVGEIANFIMSAAYVLFPSILYRFKKGRWWVTVSLIAACLIQIGVSLLVNRYITFPLYGELSGSDGADSFHTFWPFVVYFNIIKSVSVSVIVFLIYKPLSRLIKATSARFSKKRPAAKNGK